MIPVAFLLVIAVLIIGFLMYRYGPRDPKPKTWPKGMSPVINWDVLLSPEVQICLPKDKEEAIRRYRKQAAVSYVQARDAVEYAISHPDRISPPGMAHKSKGKPITTSSEPPVRFENIDWDVLLSPPLQECINQNLNEATRRYVMITSTTMKTAKEAIAYYMGHRDEDGSHIRIYMVTDAQEKTIRQLLNEHKRAEAIQVYQEMTGVNEEKAIEDVDALRKEMVIEHRYKNRDPRFDR